MANIQDFGQKIGGAKKDLWKGRGLDLSDIVDFNEAERDQFITKDNIWPKPNYQELQDVGYSKDALYFIKLVKDSIPTKPQLSSRDDAEAVEIKQEAYIQFLTEFKEWLLNVRTEQDIDNFSISYLSDKGYINSTGYRSTPTFEGSAFITNKFFKALQTSSRQAHDQAMKKRFLYTDEDVLRDSLKVIDTNHYSVEREKDYNDRVCIKVSSGGSTHFYYPRRDDLNDLSVYEGKPYVVALQSNVLFAAASDKEARQLLEAYVAEANEKNKDKDSETKKTTNRKKSLKPKQLAHIERTPEPARTKDAFGQDFLDDFNIKGGEFGNYLNDKDRQASMNFAYDSFKDLAAILKINDEDISLNGKLSIAFGARGSGNALAHYETAREVINLTKMRGAGSLAHEYFHAIDDIVGKANGCKSFMTENGSGSVPSFDKLVSTLKYKTATKEEIKELRQEYHDRRVGEFKKTIDQMVPDSCLTDEQKQEKSFIVENSLEKAMGGKDFSIKPKESIPRLSAFVDEHSEYYKMTTGNQRVVCGKLDNVRYSYDTLVSPIDESKPSRIQTDFYKDAGLIDGSYSKMGHGYWQSTVELAARAFACYAQDKLTEAGIRNDYLVGHAETPPVPCGENMEKLAYAYPRGEERERLNICFDEIVAELKTMELFTERAQPIEVSAPAPQSITARVAEAKKTIEVQANETPAQIRDNEPQLAWEL